MHLPQLKSKNKKIYVKARNFLNNNKILCFINYTLIDKFYSKIKIKYNNITFGKFFAYFDKTYLDNNNLIKRYWNHSYFYRTLKKEIYISYL